LGSNLFPCPKNGIDKALLKAYTYKVNEFKELNMINVFMCKRCGHQWASKQRHPRICPKCKSASWDIEKKRASREEPDIPSFKI